MKIGATELILILVVALLVIGPDKLPGYAKKLGKGLGSLKDSSNQIAASIRENVTEPLQDIVEPLQEIAEPIREITKPIDEATRSLKEIGKPRPKAVQEAEALSEMTPDVVSMEDNALYEVEDEEPVAVVAEVVEEAAPVQEAVIEAPTAVVEESVVVPAAEEAETTNA